MATIEDGVVSSPARGGLWPWANKRRFQRLFARQALRSYLYLSLGMGLVAFSLPLLLVASGGYDGHYSISHYYFAGDTARNILVGSLWATGTFLFLFHGLSNLENRILNIAGVAAVSVAMNPTAEQQCGNGFSIHGASAVVFFLCLAIVAVGLSKGRIRYIVYAPKRRFFEMAYNFAGVAMIGMPTTIAAIHFLDRGPCESHSIFWIESFGIWAFSFYWFVKTYEYRLLLRI
jgi:hypothetical protein